MRKKMRTAAVVMAGILGLTGLAACGGSDKGSEGKEGGAKGGIELNVSHYYLEEERGSNAVGDSYLAMIEKYQKDHPDVAITQQAMSHDDYSTKIQAQAAVNEVPDVFMVKGSWVDNFVQNGIVAPMNDYLDKYEYKDKFREGVFDAAARDGQIYGMPNQLSITSVVYYNAELWKSIGYDTFPDNWDDIYAAAEKFKEKGVSAISLGNSEKWAAESCILSTLGDRFTGTDWTNSIIARDGKAKFTDDKFVSALSRLQEMAAKNVLNPDFNTITEPQGVEYYSQGKSASVVSGHWSVAAIESFADEATQKNTKVAVLPSEDGSKPGTISGGCGWYFAVNKNLTGEKLDAAMDFVMSTTGYEMCEYAAKKYGIMGAGLVEDVDVSAFKQLTQDFIALANEMSFTPVYDLAMDGAVIEVMNTGLQDLLNGSKEPKALAEDIQAEQDKLK